MWLSSLAEGQPFMTQSEALRNRALFDDLTELLVSLITTAQDDFWNSAPEWLHWLVRLWHRRRPDVITFNYDTIIEQSMLWLDAPGADGDIVASLLQNLPRRAPGADYAPLQSPSFRLHKLHGSVDWYWNTEDRSGETLCRLAPYIPEQDKRAALAGKTPFIVPPLATKASFFGLGQVRELWHQAAHAIQQADRVILIGYSVAVTDLATTTMLSASARSESEWHVVDPDADSVASRLERLGVPTERIRRHLTLSDWVDWYEADHAANGSEVMRRQLERTNWTHREVAPIMVRRNRGDYLMVVGIEPEKERLILHARERLQGEVIEASFPRTAELQSILAQRQASVMVSRVSGIEGEHVVLGALDPQTVRGAHAVIEWCPIEIQDLLRRPIA
jgi:hypothetical protein